MGPEKVAQTLLEPPFPGGLPQPQVYPTYCKNKYKANSSIKQGPLVVASWNVRTLQNTGLGARGRITLIACERARYNIDIATLSEARLPEEGSLVEMERINGERRHISLEWSTQHGVGLAKRQNQIAGRFQCQCQQKS